MFLLILAHFHHALLLEVVAVAVARGRGRNNIRGGRGGKGYYNSYASTDNNYRGRQNTTQT